jgi:hypothetical protein
MNKLIQFRLFVGIVCVTALYLSASFANGLFHSPDQGMALNLLLFLLGEAASAVAVVAFLGLIWAAFAPRWVSRVFRFAWGHLNMQYMFFMRCWLLLESMQPCYAFSGAKNDAPNNALEPTPTAP